MGILKISAKISQYPQENTYVGVFFIKVVGLKVCNFIKKRLQRRYFPVDIAFKSEHLISLKDLFIDMA